MVPFRLPVLTLFYSQETEQSTEHPKQGIEDREIDRRQLQLVRKLGTGQFREVWEGRWKGLWNNTTSVAVMTLKPGTISTSDILEEAAFMMRLHHPKIVQLYAVCTKVEPIYIVMELMKHGSLLEYLRKGEGRSLKLPQLINMAEQVASGMAYLEEQNYIHRILAARNIFVGENLICKVCDFQQAKVLKHDIYEAPAGSKFLVKWTALEAALYNRYSIKSDVWSFGIVLYEIITYGRTPYPVMTHAQVMEALQKDYRMPCPQGCPDKLHNIMMDCWQENPVSRPTFETLQRQLEEFFTDDTGYPKVDDA